MINRIMIYVFAVVMFTACSSTTQHITNNVNKVEKINPIEVKKTSKDYGKISVYKYEKNIDNKTKVFLTQCTIKHNEETSCNGYMYELMYDEEWLVHSHTKVEAHKIIEVSSNKYYLKLQNIDDDKVSNVTGLLELKSKYTNYVKLELE